MTIMIRLSRGSQKSFNFPPPRFGLLRVRPILQETQKCMAAPAAAYSLGSSWCRGG